MTQMKKFLLGLAVALLFCGLASADEVVVNTGNPDGKMAVASRPDSAGKIEIEAADDFILGAATNLVGATFTGLLPSNALVSSIQDVTVEIYRVFPNDSNFPPDGHVFTRVNSPSDVAFDSRDSGAGGLTLAATFLSSSFTASNSVLNGIHPLPNQRTGGEGPVTGEEVQFAVSFSTAIDLPADHYFFVPQVQLSNGDFFWLSAPKPIEPPGTPFLGDLQAWVRNADLDPDWSRVGGDIVGGTPAPAFNMAFTVNGTPVPEPSSALLVLMGLVGLTTRFRRRTN
jgi:hypothetical protein